jgi:hypothetical protein
MVWEIYRYSSSTASPSLIRSKMCRLHFQFMVPEPDPHKLAMHFIDYFRFSFMKLFNTETGTTTVIALLKRAIFIP